MQNLENLAQLRPVATDLFAQSHLVNQGAGDQLALVNHFTQLPGDVYIKRFLDDGHHGKLFISVGKRQEQIYISFKDTGKGIKKGDMNKVFDPFFTTKGALGGSEIPGTGLGLSVSYAIISRHNGTIDVSSEVGKGTEFVIKLNIK